MTLWYNKTFICLFALCIDERSKANMNTLEYCKPVEDQYTVYVKNNILDILCTKHRGYMIKFILEKKDKKKSGIGSLFSCLNDLNMTYIYKNNCAPPFEFSSFIISLHLWPWTMLGIPHYKSQFES